MRRPRHLSPEERALWDRVAQTAAPMHPRRAPPAAEPEAPKAPEPPAAPPAAPLPRFRVGAKVDHRGSDDLLPGLAEGMAARPVRMDARAHKQMTRGKLRPEARIDLHGMTLAEAHTALNAFVLTSQMTGRRLVLVITGKGRVRDDAAPMPARAGALRHQVPHWLSLPPLAGAVLQVTPAHRRHGGDGAYYVYLGRRR
ncbi:Smr/MutS family protein [Wenxinia marina]|uniref:Smr domain-containing protein n=1 Tax=Wenxinia marina DSM 24838 TaxID=1123501 RepID=A0A0D0NS61_9RHOB|nr:Smr/MutS family protein [Wenxinia marina]KIQ71070.1 hypothetical protein Wenmar_00448 [Wenxinia marina DSM 24838]GGL55089.1 DNA mismatch repair protein MutS [Wenxinia marina]